MESVAFKNVQIADHFAVLSHLTHAWVSLIVAHACLFCLNLSPGETGWVDNFAKTSCLNLPPSRAWITHRQHKAFGVSLQTHTCLRLADRHTDLPRRTGNSYLDSPPFTRACITHRQRGSSALTCTSRLAVPRGALVDCIPIHT